ncbi:hypothetical protein J6I39_00350 [bacterium]|nr:hypothetical protein [bacterium]
MDVNSANMSPNFGAIMATPKAVQYIQENLSNRAMKKLNSLIEQQKDNPYNIKLDCQKFEPSISDVFLGYPEFSCKTLVVTAGDKTFNDAHFLSTSIGTIKKAIKYLSKYVKAQEMEMKNDEILGKLLKIEG